MQCVALHSTHCTAYTYNGAPGPGGPGPEPRPQMWVLGRLGRPGDPENATGRCPQDGPRGLQDAPRRPRQGSKEGPERPNSLSFQCFVLCDCLLSRRLSSPTPQDFPTSSQERHKTAQEAPKMAQTHPNRVPRRPKRRPRAPRDGLRGSQDGRKTTQEVPNIAEHVLKTAQTGSQEPPEEECQGSQKRTVTSQARNTAAPNSERGRNKL